MNAGGVTDQLLSQHFRFLSPPCFC
ncbi:hypothetical protein OIU84_003944, partial [Salix udensis]